MPLGRLQLHIAGPQRSGKSELARRITDALRTRGERPVIIDIDETRARIFPEDNASYEIGDRINQQIQRFSYNAVFEIRIPDVLSAGGIPITTATHAHELAYLRAAEASKKIGSVLRFLLLEPATEQEVARRSKLDDNTSSDIRDLTDETQLQVYRETVKRFVATYSNPRFGGKVCWIRQGTPHDMFLAAWDYLNKQGNSSP